MPLRPLHMSLLMLVNVIWGFGFVITRWGLEDVSSMQFAILRFAFLALILAPFLRWVPGKMGKMFLIAMSLGAWAIMLMFIALKYTDSVSSLAIVVQLGVPISALFSMWLIKEKVTALRWLGIALAMAGVTLLAFDITVLNSIRALMLGLLSTVGVAIAMPLIRSMGKVNVWTIQVWVATLSLPIMLVVSIYLGERVWDVSGLNTTAWWAIAYNVLGASVIGHASLYYLTQRYEVSKVMPATILTPVLGILFSTLFLNEILTWPIIIGGAITLAGVWVVNRY